MSYIINLISETHYYMRGMNNTLRVLKNYSFCFLENCFVEV